MMKKSKRRIKYQDGGVVEEVLTEPTTGDPKPIAKKKATPLASTPTPAPDPNVAKLKSKYKSNPYLVDPAGNNNRYFWATQTNREFPLTGGNVGEAVRNAAKLNNIDPALLYSSAMEEGMSGAIDTKNWENASEAYVDWAAKNPQQGEKFLVDGFYNYGLDQFAGIAPTLEKKGYLPKGFSSNYTTFDAANEKKEKIKASAFNTDANALIAKSAMLRLSQDQLDSYVKKSGTNLTDRQKQFFLLANYNGGEGNMQKMIDSYKQKGYLKDDKFLDASFQPESFGSIYSNVMARIQSADMLRSEKVFAYGGKIPKVPKYQNGTPEPIDPVTGLPTFTPTGNQAGNNWGNIASTTPTDPSNPQVFRIDNTGTPTKNNSSIAPLSQFYDVVNGSNGNQELSNTGQYVNAQGQTTTPQEQQQTADQISQSNRRAADQRQSTMGDIEMVSAASITAINAFLQRNNQGQQNRTNRRDALMRETFAPIYNPYAEGTGSQAIMKKGGKIKKNDIPGEDVGIQTLDGGKAKVISTSDHSNPMVEFTGKEHPQGGIGVQFGGNVAEVEDKEVGWIDNEGSLNIFGKLKLPGSNMTFRKAAENIADQEAKVDGQKSKYLNILNNGNIADPYQKTAQSTAKVMFKSLDKQSKQIAEQKEALSSYQNLILGMVDAGTDKKYGGKMPRKTYPDGGKVLEKTGFRDPNYTKRLIAMGLPPDPQNFNTGDFQFSSSLTQTPMQSPTNFNTGDFQFNSAIQQVPMQTPQNFNTGDFQFNSSIKMTPKPQTRTTSFNTGDFEGNSTITQLSPEEYRKRREADRFEEGGEIDGDPIEDLKKLREAIGKFESSGNYKARGVPVTKGQYKGQRALGKYQVMPGNLPTWSKEALGREVTEQEFLDNPSIQDQIIDYRLNQTSKKYGNPQDIASIWFSGRPLSGNSSKDDNNTSVPGYVAAVMKNYGGADLISSSDGSTVRSNDPGKIITNDIMSNFTPVYKPVGGSGVSQAVNTKYGAAVREPAPFSDKATISDNSRQRDFMSPLALEQIAPELLAVATNNREAVPQLSYQPDLQQTFDISYQLGRNENQSTFNQAAALAEQTGNVDALYQLAAQKYKADQAYNVQEIQGNAQQKLQVYAQNTNTMNDAQMKNLALIADQQVKQAQADFNTQAQDMAAIRSVSGKSLQNELENKTYNAYANLFKHYGFDKKGNVTFEPDKVSQRFTPGEAQAFGMMSAQQGAQAIMNGDFSRQFTRVKNDGGGTTTTEILGTNKKIQEEYKALKNQGFDDAIIGNMLRAKYPETITQ